MKAVSPSPFYDGKYHPPLNEQFSLLYILRYELKLQKLIPSQYKNWQKLCTGKAQIKYAVYLFWLSTDPLSPGTFHREHSNQPGKQQRIEAPHETPGIRYIY